MGPSRRSWKISLTQKHSHEHEPPTVTAGTDTWKPYNVTSGPVWAAGWHWDSSHLTTLSVAGYPAKGEPIPAHPFCYESKHLSSMCYVKSYANGLSKHHMRQKTNKTCKELYTTHLRVPSSCLRSIIYCNIMTIILLQKAPSSNKSVVQTTAPTDCSSPKVMWLWFKK